MTESMMVALMSLFGTLAGTFAGIITSTKLSNYRIEQLEKKVEKHNGVIERMALAEKDIRVINHRIGDLEEFHKHE